MSSLLLGLGDEEKEVLKNVGGGGVVSEFAQSHDNRFLDTGIVVMEPSFQPRDVGVGIVLKLPDDAGPCFD